MLEGTVDGKRVSYAALHHRASIWIRFAFGEDFERRWDQRAQVRALSSCRPNGIILVGAQKTIRTGAQVQLDVGTVPEIQHGVEVYAIDPAAWTIVSQRTVWGGPAVSPKGSKRLGSTSYVSEWHGPAPDDSSIRNTIESMLEPSEKAE